MCFLIETQVTARGSARALDLADLCINIVLMQMNKEEIPIDLSEIERREDVITVDVPVRLRLLQPSMIQLV